MASVLTTKTLASDPRPRCEMTLPNKATNPTARERTRSLLDTAYKYDVSDERFAVLIEREIEAAEQAARADVYETLASAQMKVMPYLAKQVAERWATLKLEAEDKALDGFLAFIRARGANG